MKAAILSILALALTMATSAWAQITEEAPRRGLSFFLNGPTPAFNQQRTPRPKRTTGQFQVGAKGVLGDSPLGRWVLDSDNIISTDAFDIASRYSLKLGAERNGILSGIAFATNQQNSNPTLSASIGASLPLWQGQAKVAGFTIQEPGAVDFTFFRYENRLKVNPLVSPHHVGKNVLTPSLGLRLPPLFFGKKTKEMSTSNTAHLTFNSNVWFFLDEKAAPGFSPRTFESQVRAQIVLPKESLPFQLPLVQGISLGYNLGANPASGYARVNQFIFNFQLFDFANTMKAPGR